MYLTNRNFLCSMILHKIHSDFVCFKISIMGKNLLRTVEIWHSYTELGRIWWLETNKNINRKSLSKNTGHTAEKSVPEQHCTWLSSSQREDFSCHLSPLPPSTCAFLFLFFFGMVLSLEFCFVSPPFFRMISMQLQTSFLRISQKCR
jgi:hypothetical protein